ncbi:hypothetical protein A54_103 [Septuagintavirus sv54]|uniref:Uncharacterized protein n=1 Tax=Escherichia phage A5-4 TaxID=2996162 RepID=A0AAE9PR04_9CAUD|nr:hypothetical protein A54_103 [Escherichia phage A5-4]
MNRIDQLKVVQHMAYRILEVQKGSKKEVCEKAYKVFSHKADDWKLQKVKKADILGYLEEEIRIADQKQIRRDEAEHNQAWQEWFKGYTK